MRIIGGEFSGRRLECPSGGNTRPTPDRVKGAVFMILQHEIEGARVLEMFGGTGALGLEALSRGAAHAVFCEVAKPALTVLIRNIDSLGVRDRCTVHHRSAFDLPKVLRGGAPFDLVFCDPPHRYLDDLATRIRLAEALSEVPLAPGGRVVLEHRARALGEFAPAGLVPVDHREWGSTGMAFYAPAVPPGAPASGPP